MGRKLWQSHIAALGTAPPPNISSVRESEEGEAAFNFHYSKDGRPESCQLKLLVADLDEYPDGEYFVFTDDNNADSLITSSVDIIRPLLNGKSLGDALAELVQLLSSTLSKGRAHNPVAIDDSDADIEEEDSDDGLHDYDVYDDDDCFDLGGVVSQEASRSALASRSRQSLPNTSTVDIKKIKADLLAVKEAGFRVGVIGNLATGGILSVSIRVTKLGISEEAMQAWALKRTHYFILLIRYLHGYRDATQVRADSTAPTMTEMRVVLCDHYKPSRDDALTAFGQDAASDMANADAKTKPIEPLFIASPLNDLLRDRFYKIINFRASYAFNWPSAEEFVHEIQGKTQSDISDLNMDNYYLPDDVDNNVLPDVVKADEMSGKLLKESSLPLIAMQFLLRHFVRCTEFCLVCHRKVEDTFEALKPYVCSRPLCLYQYMALGFGPSIEWEVISQPYVVDLLVSFCYAAAASGRLKEFPVGIDLRVPRLPNYTSQLVYYRHGSVAAPAPKSDTSPEYQPSFTAALDRKTNQLLLQSTQASLVKGLRTGDWIIVRSQDTISDHHYRIEEAMFPSYTLSNPIVHTSQEAAATGYSRGQPATPAGTRPSTPGAPLAPGVSNVECWCYSSSFDDLDNNEKQHAIMTLLQTLPDVSEMQSYLEGQRTIPNPSLKAWRSRISDSALNLLRWIIASNRSCIMQVDSVLQDGKPQAVQRTTTGDHVVGMDEWMQFRFAQGAPDKEQRFVNSVSAETGDQQFPTFFAWHGSPIVNWHSIIRQGLRFDDTLHGRAFGHGIYMSHDLNTSIGYTRVHGQNLWPQSVLKISMAMSLQEVVNAPTKFVCHNPHYVVSNIDWVQTRYLFIKTSTARVTKSNAPINEYVQDPTRSVRNASGSLIQVPMTAVSKSRRPATTEASTKKGGKKTKMSTKVDQATAEQREDDANSTVSDEEDREWYSSDNDDMSFDDDVYEVPAESVKHKFAKTSGRKRERETDFEPGTLDMSNIQTLKPPEDASPTATQALMRWYKDAIKVQKTTPLHELGWYIDPNQSDNMYQRIVELHSFNPKLPLAQDMKNAGVTSIVLEMRFTNEFPYSPPFIRVVQPRFLPFNQGGGGHVTEGGAICMELLTNTGWSAVTQLAPVLLQVQLAVSEEERPARLLYRDSKAKGKASYGYGARGDSYGVGEAIAAYERACRAHGWQIPAGFSQFDGR